MVIQNMRLKILKEDKLKYEKFKVLMCPKCKSEDVSEFASKYTEKGYWCDDCGHEWEKLK